MKHTGTVSLDDDSMSKIVHEAMSPKAVWLLFTLLGDPSGKLLVQGAHILLDLLLGNIPGSVIKRTLRMLCEDCSL